MIPEKRLYIERLNRLLQDAERLSQELDEVGEMASHLCAEAIAERLAYKIEDAGGKPSHWSPPLPWLLTDAEKAKLTSPDWPPRPQLNLMLGHAELPMLPNEST